MSAKPRTVFIALGVAVATGALYFLFKKEKNANESISKPAPDIPAEVEQLLEQETGSHPAVSQVGKQEFWQPPVRVNDGKAEGFVEEIVACISRACKLHAYFDSKCTDSVGLMSLKETINEERTAMFILDACWPESKEVLTCNDFVCYALKVKSEFGQAQLVSHLTTFESRINSGPENISSNITLRRSSGRRSIGGPVDSTSGSIVDVANLPSSWLPILTTRVASIFRRLDLNGDHFIDKAEILELHGGDRQTTESMFADLDTDHDGIIVGQEFVEYFIRVLKRCEDKDKKDSQNSPSYGADSGKAIGNSLAKGKKLVGKIMSILEGKLQDRDERLCKGP